MSRHTILLHLRKYLQYVCAFNIRNIKVYFRKLFSEGDRDAKYDFGEGNRFQAENEIYFLEQRLLIFFF